MPNASLSSPDAFVNRHLGPRSQDIEAMLKTLDVASLDQLVDRAVPPAIRMQGELELPEPRTEAEVLEQLRAIAGKTRCSARTWDSGTTTAWCPR